MLKEENEENVKENGLYFYENAIIGFQQLRNSLDLFSVVGISLIKQIES